MAYHYPRKLGIGRAEVLEIVRMRCEEVPWNEIAKKFGRDAKTCQEQVYDIIFSSNRRRRVPFNTPLEKWMLEHQMRLVDLEKITGYSDRTIYSVMSNRGRVSDEVLRVLSQVTGIPADSFYPGGMPNSSKE